jgi:uncharacterized protein (DUF1501 family)
MHRRDVLKLLAATPLGLSSTRLLAAPQAGCRLLVVFMRGGYDCANLLVPISSSFYYESRPTIAIARPEAGGSAAPGGATNTALTLDANWGLHPALRDSLYPLWQKGQLAFVPFAGTDDLTRSHFETQDTVELGQPLEGSRDFRSGFLNRLVTVLASGSGASAPIAFTDQLPIILRGSSEVPNMALKTIGKPGVDQRQGNIIAAMYRNTPLAAPVTEGFGTRDDIVRTLNDEMDKASRNAVSAHGFELEARRVARLMKERYNVGFVDIGGWDTHVNEGGATGYLANRLDEFGRGLAGFADEMGTSWNQTVVVVVSEFGRTFRENGNRGTDHGHGTVYWVLGGAVAGGRIAGEQVAVGSPTLFQNRDYPVLNEYRALFGGLFNRLYGLSPGDLARVFAGVKPRDLALV